MNTLIPFMINDAPVRGRVVRLESVIDAILARHDYPPRLSEWLAETLVLAAMLASNLKSDGILTIQIQSKGPVSLLVVDAVYGGALRGYAQYDDAAVSAIRGEKLASIFAEGYLAITLDPGAEGQRYQGVVPLEGATITETVQHYFSQSQQLHAEFRSAVGRQTVLGDAADHWIAAGMYIERMPDEGDRADADEAWNRSRALLGTLRDDELLDAGLPLSDLLHRLFHEDGVWVYEPQLLKDECRCSREKIGGVLRGMEAYRLDELVEDGKITVNCQFCSTDYVFNPAELSD